MAAALAVLVVAISASACSDSDDDNGAPGGGTGGEQPSPSPRAVSGLGWTSGANGNFPQEVNAWSEFTGRPVDLAVVFTARANWHDITEADWPVGDFAREYFPGELSVAQPLFPPDGDEASCARGDYDEHWAAFGRTLTKFGRGDAYVRLGWEFNGVWFYWHARDAETWKTCFRNAAAALRSTAPDVKIEWNMSAHADRIPNGSATVWELYPGDEFVDVVSIDAYDSWPPSSSLEVWDRQCHFQSGVCTVIEFAREHGKPFAVPEWGVASSEGGGGDNPFFVHQMFDLFVQNSDILAYEAYYNNAEDDNVRSSLVSPAINPKSAEMYLQYFGRPTAPTTPAT